MWKTDLVFDVLDMCVKQILPEEGSQEAARLEIMEYIFTILFTIELCINLFGSWYVLVSSREFYRVREHRRASVVCV